MVEDVVRETTPSRSAASRRQNGRSGSAATTDLQSLARNAGCAARSGSPGAGVECRGRR